MGGTGCCRRERVEWKTDNFHYLRDNNGSNHWTQSQQEPPPRTAGNGRKRSVMVGGGGGRCVCVEGAALPT